VTSIDTTSTDTTSRAERVRAACEQLLASTQDVTFAAVAATSQISRTTCYRDRQLRSIIDGYRDRHGEHLTLTTLADRFDNLAQTVEALAARVRRQEEEIRALKRAAATRPTRNKIAD
jgi:predicted ribosome quality control (RQC) complex YloA/Tae2 family protein